MLAASPVRHTDVLFLALPSRKRVDGKFLGPGGASVPASQALCSSILEECYEIAHETKARGDSLNVSESLRPIYDRLKGTRTELERLSLTHRWTLKETDLYNFTVALAEIDRMRKDGRWGELEEKDEDIEKKSKAAGQYVSGNLPLYLPVFDILWLISSSRCCFIC
jgi:hypothetical protein